VLELESAWPGWDVWLMTRTTPTAPTISTAMRMTDAVPNAVLRAKDESRKKGVV
jgi:hypothetical protein